MRIRSLRLFGSESGWGQFIRVESETVTVKVDMQVIEVVARRIEERAVFKFRERSWRGGLSLFMFFLILFTPVEMLFISGGQWTDAWEMKGFRVERIWLFRVERIWLFRVERIRLFRVERIWLFVRIMDYVMIGKCGQFSWRWVLLHVPVS
jgi:hypothetical protein